MYIWYNGFSMLSFPMRLVPPPNWSVKLDPFLARPERDGARVQKESVKHRLLLKLITDDHTHYTVSRLRIYYAMLLVMESVALNLGPCDMSAKLRFSVNC